MDALAPGARLRERSVPENGTDKGSTASASTSRNRKRPPCRIFRPAQSVMQAGTRGTKDWTLEFEPGAPPYIEPLMGWTASDDPYAQLRLKFPSREVAARHAERLGLEFRVKTPAPRRHRPKSYMETITGRPSH